MNSFANNISFKMKIIFSIFCVTLFCLNQVSSNNRALQLEPSWYVANKGVVNIINRYYNGSCVGTLIHSEWILTSAVCAKRVYYQEMRILFGDIYSYENAGQIKNVYIHPEFENEIRENDIALIELSIPANTSKRILKIPRVSSSLVAKKCIILRWTFYPENWNTLGTTKPGENNEESPKKNESKDILLKNAKYEYLQPVVILDNELCSNYPVHVSEYRLCTNAENACEGDEGAPLVTLDNNELIGLVSVSAVQAAICYNDNCMFPVTTYTSVVPYRDWIRDVTDLNLL